MPDLNVTMVAFHGTKKPIALEALVDEVCLEIERSYIPLVFTRYNSAQIHATLIGMEVYVEDSQVFSHWFKRNRNLPQRKVDLEKFQETINGFVLRDQLFDIRFGGFQEAYCRCRLNAAARGGWACASSTAEFHSFDRSTFEGSFYLSCPGPAMITGWPVKDPQRPHTFNHQLYAFRCAAEEAGFLDKYHLLEHPDWKDDDFFLRVGTFSGDLSAQELDSLQRLVRRKLSHLGPTTVAVNVDDVSILLYDSPSLKEENIRARVPLRDFLQDYKSVERLYERVIDQRNAD